MQVGLVPFEERMLFDLEDDIEVARRPAVGAGVALAGKAHARAVVHAGWNVDLQLALHLPVALAAAFLAGIADDLAAAAAVRAGAADGKEALLVDDFAPAVAGGTRGGTGARFRALSLRSVALFQAWAPGSRR